MVTPETKKRIAKNTLALYIRMFFVMAVSLYTSRLVLHYLGEQDYGINNVVGGIVTMFAFLSNTLASASQRYFAFELGRGNMERLRKLFSLTIALYAIIVLVILTLSEVVGIWFINEKMTIPPDRLHAAHWVFQMSIITFCVSILSTPYQAIIIAQEKMQVYAYVGILEAILQLAFILFLQYGVDGVDGLIAYGATMLIYKVICQLIYVVYARHKYMEVKLQFYWNKDLSMEMLSYSFWNLFGAFANVARSQGINMLVSAFFNPAVNAARGIAYSINTAILSFSNNFFTAVKPQITKNYAVGNKKETLALVFRSSKMTFFLLSFIAIPMMVLMSEIMSIWLVDVPLYTALFARIVVLINMFDALSMPIMTLMQATGRVKVYQIVTGGLILLNLPISWVLFRLGYPAVSTFFVAMVLSVMSMFSRIWVAKQYAQLPIIRYCTEVLFRITTVALMSYAASVCTRWFFSDNMSIMETCIALILSVFFSVIIIFAFGLTAAERNAVFTICRKHLKIITKKQPV